MEKIQDFFRKYYIWPFIISAFFTTISLYDPWKIYYGIFETGIDYSYYFNSGSFMLFGFVALLIFILYLKSSDSPALYNKSYAISLMIAVPFILLGVLIQYEFYIPKMVLISLYVVFLLVLLGLYIKNRDNLADKNPLEGREFFKESLKVEIIQILSAYIFLIIAIKFDLLILILYGIVWVLIYKKTILDKDKKTYLDEITNKNIFSFSLIIFINIILRIKNGLLYGSLIFWILVLIYFAFIRKRIIEKAYNN